MKDFIERIIYRIDKIRRVKLWNFICGYLTTQIISLILCKCMHASYGGLIIGSIITLGIFIGRHFYLKKKEIVTATIKNLMTGIYAIVLSFIIMFITIL